MAFELSIIIPARNEEWLAKTVESVIDNTNDCTEVLVALDEAWPAPPGLQAHPRVSVIHQSPSIGQRAAINRAAQLSQATYLCKLDAHCRVDKDFDLKLMADCQPNWIMVPRLYNLHVFDWRCLACGTRTYQGPLPTACTTCNESGRGFDRVVVWEPRWNRMTDFMRFDSDLKFQYWRDFKKRPEGKPDLAPTMSLLGACFFLPRKLYWDIDGCDEAHGGWGQQGTEMAAKIQTFGGELIATKKVWYSHLFRTAPGFGFPYKLTHGQTEAARNYSKAFWREGKWSKAVRPLSWIVEKFWPVPGWDQKALDNLKSTESRTKQVSVPEIKAPYVKSASDTGLTKGIVYYTENKCPEPIFSTVQKQLQQSLNGHQLVSVSLKPIEFGDNIVLGLQRSYLTMFQQILAGLSLLDTDFAFLCEHDVLYAPEHFQFTPPRKDTYYYNEAVWTLSARTGKTLFRYRRSTSQLCADRRLLIDHYRERIARIEKEGFSYRNGFEPGTRKISHGGYDNFRAQSWFAERPNIDIRDHGSNLTRTLWKRESFRNPKFTAGWEESDRVPGWPGITLGRFSEWLAEIK